LEGPVGWSCTDRYVRAKPLEFGVQTTASPFLSLDFMSSLSKLSEYKFLSLHFEIPLYNFTPLGSPRVLAPESLFYGAQGFPS